MMKTKEVVYDCQHPRKIDPDIRSNQNQTLENLAQISGLRTKNDNETLVSNQTTLIIKFPKESF